MINEEIEAMDLEELARIVIHGNYTPGLHDRILIERCKKVDDND